MSASPIGAKYGASLVAGPFRGLAAKSDKRLVELAQRGDVHAVEVLYDRYATAILRYCRSLLRSTQEAEDVQQEVFLQALSAIRDGAGPETFRPWLYRVAHNACISHMRAKRPTLTAVDGDFVAAATTVQPASDEREELRQLLNDLSALPEVQRGALLLREMDGFSYEQVGEVLGLPVTTVRSTIFRARSTLQGLAEARDAKCAEIQAELSRLADRRGRRSRRITSHLKVCGDCREFRDGLRERATILRGFVPAVPLGVIEGAETIAAEGAGIAGAGAAIGASSGFGLLGGGGAAKLIAAAASTCALVGGAGTQIGVLGGGSGAAVDAEPSTTTAESAVTAALYAASGPGARDHTPATFAGAGPDSEPISFAAPGTVVWRPAADGGTHGVEGGRDRHRLALQHGSQSGRGHSSSAASGHHSGAFSGAQFHSLAASESGFLLADQGGPTVRRYESEASDESSTRDRDGTSSTESSGEGSTPTSGSVDRWGSGSGDRRGSDEPATQQTTTTSAPSGETTQSAPESGTSGPAAATEPSSTTADPGTYKPPPSDPDPGTAPAPAPTVAPGPGEPSSTQVDPAASGTTTSEPAQQDPAATAP